MTTAHEQPLTGGSETYHHCSSCSEDAGEHTLITIQSSLELHSCSTHKFFSDLPPDFKYYKDVVNLIAQYYTPEQESIQSIKHSLQTSVHPFKVRCNSVPIPSWTISSDDDQNIKRFPSLCPYLTQHMTLEFLFWILILLFFRTGGSGPSAGSIAVLLVFYLLIQAMVWSMGCLYNDGFYRYQHIMSAPLFLRSQRIQWFNTIFNWTPKVSLSMDLHQSDSMADMGWDTVAYDVNVAECATFIDPILDSNLMDEEERDGEYNAWIYALEYETDIDFVDGDVRNNFERLCVKFIRHHVKDEMVYHMFDVKVEHEVPSGYNERYWSGYMIVLNTRYEWMQSVMQYGIKLLNVLCLSLLYKLPLKLIPRRRVKVIKYLGFDD